jgi:hypothetical protein
MLSTLYIALDALKNGDLDEAEIVREWSDYDSDTSEAFQLVLRRDVIGRHEAEKVDQVLEELRQERTP